MSYAERVLMNMPVERRPLVVALWRAGNELDAAHDGARSEPLPVLNQRYEKARADLAAWDRADRVST